MARVFINYRHSESEYAAGSLGRELRERFGDQHVFRDKEDIDGGVSWKQRVLAEIDSGAALLVLIGRNWADATDGRGGRRLDNTDDPIRLEIADALRDGAVVIPILLENADMPEAAQLPADIRALSELNALRLRDSDWQQDVERVCAALQRTGFRLTDPTSGRSVRRLAPMPIAAVVVSLVVVGVVAYSVLARKGLSSTTPLAQHATPVPRLDFGVWTLKGKVDTDGPHVLDDSILKITSQSETSDGLLVEGTFTWRLDGILLGEERVKGHYLAATRQIFLEGVALKETAHPEFPQGSLVLGSYSAVLSGDGRALVNGLNGSTAESANVALKWEGTR